MSEAIRGANRARPFAPWRIVVWTVMLLAAFGFVINGYYAYLEAMRIHDTGGAPGGDGASPYIALAWGLGYALVSFFLMATALSTLRWAEWARRALRVFAPILAVWMAYTAWLMYGQWQQLGAVLSQPGLPEELLAQASKNLHIMLVVLILKAIAVPVLGWLAWALGSVATRQQFAVSR